MIKNIAVALYVIIFAFTATISLAQSKQTLGSGPDVYRIEVKNLNRFEVLEAGDTDGVGELYEMSVRLEGGDFRNRQTDGYTDNAGLSRQLINRSTNDLGNNTFVNIRVGNHIVHGGHQRNRDLWIHSRRENSRDSTIPIRLVVTATELDCALARVCNRQSRGQVSVSFTIPNFRTPPSNICGPENTFKLLPVDGELTILGVDNLDVHSSATGDTRIFNILTQHKTGGPRLRPFNADICIASTVKPETRVASAQKLWFMRNKASGRCLELPRQNQSREIAATVSNCSLANAAGRPALDKWIMTPLDYLTVSIRSSVTNKCLNLKSSVDNREGGSVKLVGCSNHNDQKWELLQSGGDLKFKNVSSGKCLNLHGREHRENGQVSVYTCADTPDQIWSRIDERTANDIAPLIRARR